MERLTSFYVIYMAWLYLTILVFSVVSYVLCGKGLSAIARRRGIEKPWLAWVPVGNMWLLGCISDQYRYVVHGLETNRRGNLLTMSIITTVCSLLLSGLSVFVTGMAGDSVGSATDMAFILLVVCYAVVAVAVVQTVMQFKAYFDLFRSCDPDKSLIYLLVSIFAGFPMPFFVYSCRDKDLGMPPRKDGSEIVVE